MIDKKLLVLTSPVAIWLISLPLPAFGLVRPHGVAWYPGWTMFLGGLAGQFFILSAGMLRETRPIT